MTDPHDTHSRESGLDVIRHSAHQKRAKKQTRRQYALIAALLCFSVMLLLLVVMAVAAIANRVADTPAGPDRERVEWGTISVSPSDTKQGPLVIVNGTHEYTFPATAEHLEEIYAVWAGNPARPYQQSGISTYMERTALTALDKMLTDFAAATGKKNVQIRAAYRSKADQEGYSVLPGFSDHHTGFGCELKYVKEGSTNSYEFSADESGVYNWINDNCHKYGFIVRYPESKTDKTGVSDYTSYYRYVGPAHTTYMKEHDLCMEEYIEVLKAYNDHKKPLAVSAADGKHYEIYYVAVDGSTTVQFPTNYAYTLSGTNEGGVVITVDRSKALDNSQTETESVAP